MADIKKTSQPDLPRRPPATTPEARENQLISLAVEVAEQQMRDGTASAQVITHYLKLGTTRERLEQQKLINENKLALAKIEAMESSARVEELYEKALKAMSAYAGHDVFVEDDDDGHY